MGKRDTTECKTPPVELKRSKRNKHSKYAMPQADKKSTTLKPAENVKKIDEPAANELVKREEEDEDEEFIFCDKEVDVCSNDENTDNIDVETADNEEQDVRTKLTETPPLKTTRSCSSKTSNSSKRSVSKATTSTTPTSGMDVSTPSSRIKDALTPPSQSIQSNKKKRRRDSGTSSDEERWLTAIESGKLEDVDEELKKIKDPKLMTARQRAMYERNTERDPAFSGAEMLMSLPIGYREREKPQTAEDIQKAVLKSQRRKQQANEKREKDKKRTMERLLKKQETKQRSTKFSKLPKSNLPMLTYVNNAEGAYIKLPPDFEFPLKPQVAKEPPQVKLCGIVGCGQPKKYNCSKTNMPLCSFECYKKNVQLAKEIMC